MSKSLTTFSKSLVIIFSLLLFSTFFMSCADEKNFTVEEKTVTAQPVGWFDGKDPNFNYQVSVETVLWSIVLSETILAPVLLTGFYLWEPIEINEHCYPECKDNN